MLRTLIGLVAVTVLGWTGSALALGLGEIEARTRLNQPLSALIPISTGTPREIESLVVELASNEDFERVGMERAEYLSTLRFEIEGKSIRVFSKQPAREPFVSFLLNVRWEGGRLLREYTLLLDPPSYAEQKTAPSTPAPVVTQAPAATPTPPPATQPVEAPVETAEPEGATAAAPVPAPAPVEAAPASATSVSSYGPVQPQETLWSIAYKLRPDPNTITMDQMQVALFNANPQAFNGGRLTGLMKGSVLRVPGLDEIQAVDPVAAKTQVASARSASYQAPATAARPDVTAAPVTSPPPAPEPEPAAPETKVEPAAEPPSTAIQPSETVATTPISEPASSPPQEIAQAPASEPAVPPPTETPAEEAPAQQAQAEPTAAPPPAPVLPEKPGLAEKVMTVLGDLTDRGRELASHPLAIPAAAGFFALLFGLLGFRKLRDKYAQWSYNRASRKLLEKDKGTAAGADKTEVQEPAGRSTRAALEETSTENAATMVSPVATAGATQAFAATAVTQGARSQNLEATQQSTLQQTMVQEPAAARSGARQVDFDVTGQYASETVQINLDAGDPVSEAEFHRAYGLYDEAALLLKQALQKDPKRTDARVKLAEIYFEASKAAEFVGVAKELKGQLPEAEWQKIALLGSQIAPSDDLFKGAAAGGAGGTVDLSFDEPAAAPAPAPAPAPATAPAAAPAADSGMLDFKLEDFQLPGASAAPAAPAAASAHAGDALEFDLGGLSLDTPAAAAPAESPAEAKMEGLDLGNFDLGEPSVAPAEGESIELSTEVPAEAELAVSADDSGTKLDLARAYVDMGDNDMAKSLLNEVLQQGNEQQKQEAQKLLQRVPA